MHIECSRERPERIRISRAWSREAESDSLPDITPLRRSRSSPQTSLAKNSSREAHQLRLPRTVLISPLWHIMRKGCPRGQAGKVLVEKRW